MKAKTIAFLICCVSFLTAKAQINQRFDNTNYKTVYFKQACDLIAGTPNLVIIDVRSPGEYADTSRYISSRIGRLKGAINISIDSVTRHYKDMLAYKDKPILLYCSHSQRSRVVAKRLADSGFKNVYSMNGGMTVVNWVNDASFPCKSSLYTTSVPYKLMGPDDAVTFIKNKNNVVIDVRSVAEFNGTDTTEAYNMGRIKGAMNIPLATFDGQIDGLAKYKTAPVLIYSLSIPDAMNAALKLTDHGFKNVSVLFDGLDTFLLNFPSSSKERKELVTAAPAYKLTGVREAITLVNNTPSLVVADLRPKDQFENHSKRDFFNLGHIKNAVNFSDGAELEQYLNGKPKSTPVLIYGNFSAAMRGMDGLPKTDLSSLSKKLAAEGYTNVHLLYDGIYSVVWSSGNVEGLADAKSILTDHNGLY